MIDYYHQKTHFLNHRTWLLFVISKGDMTCHAIEKQNFIWVKFGAAAFLYRLSIYYYKYYILLKNRHDLVKNNLPLFFFQRWSFRRQAEIYKLFSKILCTLGGRNYCSASPCCWKSTSAKRMTPLSVARRPPSGLKMRPLVPVSGF